MTDETRIRAHTENPAEVKRNLRALSGEDAAALADARPLTRADCKDADRPCPFVSCAHHLYLDINDATGAIKLNFPHLEVWEMAETCALDVADRGWITLEAVAALTNLTRERVRQIEARGLSRLAGSHRRLTGGAA